MNLSDGFESEAAKYWDVLIEGAYLLF